MQSAHHQNLAIRRTPPFLVAVLTVLFMHLPRALQGEPLVGVYYYPWYGTFAGGHSLNQSLRGHLVPPQPPAIGLYSSRSATTIASHIDHSHQGNIDFWAVSWWGPQSAEDTTFRTSILTHPRRAEIQYAIHYESTGRFGSFDNPNFNNLIPDFRHLANNYFQDPNYLHIDGRPVVFMYVTRAYFNTQGARDAVANLRTAMLSEFGLDPYIVGDDLFTGGVDLQRAQLWDAITDFDVYGTVLQGGSSTSAALNQLANIYDNARAALAGHGIGFIPTASPGFNDKGVRSGHPAAPRYLEDDPNSNEGDLFARMLTDVVVARADASAGDILMINSFNEWHEDTQIEPSIIAPATDQDDSGTGQYTEGFFYPGYGNLYLDLLRWATEPALPGDYTRDGAVDASDYVVWRDTFGQTGLRLAADGNLNNEIEIGDYDVWRAHFGQTAAGATGFASDVPEPSAALLSAVTFILLQVGRRLENPRPRRSMN